MAGETFDVQYVTLHGHRRAFVKAGSGPVLLLLHGLACDHTSWDPVIRDLARRYSTVQLMEVVALVGGYTMMAMLTKNCGILLEDPETFDSFVQMRKYK